MCLDLIKVEIEEHLILSVDDLKIGELHVVTEAVMGDEDLRELALMAAVFKYLYK